MGDAYSWEALVEEFSPLVRSVLRRYRLSEWDIADVSQNVWFSLFAHLPRIREPAALPGWIVTTTRNAALRTLSAAQRTEPMEPERCARLDQAAHPELEAEIISLEERRAVRAGIRELRPAEQQLMLMLLTDPAPSYRQISRQLGIPIGSIGPTRARCLHKLRGTPAIRELTG